MKRWLILFTLTVLTPYEGIDYEEPTLYEYENEDQALDIVETLGDGYTTSPTINPLPYYLRRVLENRPLFPY